MKVLQQIVTSHEIVDTTTLAAKLMSLDRRLQNVPGDGNCLFRAVADQFQHHPTMPINLDHKDLRKAVVSYMRTHKEELMV